VMHLYVKVSQTACKSKRQKNSDEALEDMPVGECSHAVQQSAAADI